MRLPPALLAAALLAGCIGSTPRAPADDRVVILITDDASGNSTFSQTHITVKPNQIIEWRNEGNRTHQIVLDEIALAHTADLQPKGCTTRSCNVGQIKLGQVGTWGVHCKYHPNMTMQITVEQA